MNFADGLNPFNQVFKKLIIMIGVNAFYRFNYFRYLIDTFYIKIAFPKIFFLSDKFHGLQDGENFQ